MSTRAVPFGKYHLLERINVGGMAEVYKAKMLGVEGFEKLLAIKRILPAIAADKDFINMFIDEAKISVQLNHANIAQTFELGRLNDTYFIALEYVPGRDLRAVFERLKKRGEVVPPELAAYAISRVAEGLDYAHRKRDVNGRELGIIHRDISPQNLLVSYEGEVKIIDFGIAKAANKIMKTQAGILKGKFGYMSPEQVRGLPLDRRSDIFAVGIVLYELLTGDRLFTGDSDYSILEKVRAANVPRPSMVRKSVPGPLDRIVSKALAKEPDERYQHASELVADLQRYLLAQERLFTREELAAFMKGTFSEEFEREKRLLAEQSGAGEETPTAPAPSVEVSQSMPSLRPALRVDQRPRLEGGPARITAPPPPPADAFLNGNGGSGEGERMRGLPPLRASRLSQAALAAETDKINFLKPALRIDDDATLTETDPRALLGKAPKPLPPPPPPPDDELTPTPEDARFLGELNVTDMPTRVGRQPTSNPPEPAPASQQVPRPLPPPIASNPSMPRLSMPPKGPVQLPVAITDNMPRAIRRPAPPIVPVEDSDEPTMVQGRPPAAPLDDEITEERQPPPRAAAKKPVRASITDDESESTIAGTGAKAYVPRRRQSWAIVPIAAGLALALGFVGLKWRQGQLARQQPESVEEEPGLEPAEEAAPAVRPAEAASATLKVVTEPPDAQVFVDQKLVKPGGQDPFVSEHLEAEVAHVVTARKDGFKEAATTVTVARGANQTVTLRLKAKSAVLAVKTVPSGATLYVDDKPVGRSPVQIATLAPGAHTLRAELKCYHDAERSFTLGEAGETVDINMEPQPGACIAAPRRARQADEPGTLRLMSRPPARVFVDGTDTGKETPLIDFPLPAGKHSLRLVSGNLSEDVEVDIPAGKPLTKIVVLK